MKTHIKIALLLLVPTVSLAQVPVDDNGNVIGEYKSQADIMPIGDDGIPRLSQTELQELVGPIALYPDDLLAVVLPASAYPLQVVEAARFLEALKTDPTLKPDPDWDDSIVALINYPEVVELLNKDLEWTWRLGEAVVAQQADVVAAVEAFRDRAYAAGNLKSDSYQSVSRNDGVISISPLAEDVIYVPYYEPARVVHYQPRPVYYYYPEPCPVYYYPYAAGHYFDRGFFWGVTTAFSIGWMSDSLHVYHHSYRGHPYYGRSYRNDWWYRRPSISVYNTTYVNNTNVVTTNNHSDGDHWRARDSRREYVRREGYARAEKRLPRRQVNKERQYEPITFRERDAQTVTQTPVSRTRSTRRQEPAERPRTAHQQRTVDQSRDIRQPEAALPSRVSRSHDSRRQDAVVRDRDTQRQDAQVRPHVSQRQEPARQTREQAPVRTERSPAPREHRQTVSRPREQSSRPPEPRSREPRNSGSNVEKPEQRSNERRSRERDQH